MRKVFPGVCFANNNISEERIKILKSETQLNMLPVHTTDVFKKNNVARYINRLNKFFCHESYPVLVSFCFAEFLKRLGSHLLFMFYPFRLEDILLTGNLPTYQDILCPSVLSAVNKNRQKCELYADIVEETVANFSQNLLSNQSFYGQIEKDETKDSSFSDKKNASNVNTNEYTSVPFNELNNQSDESIAAKTIIAV